MTWWLKDTKAKRVTNRCVLCGKWCTDQHDLLVAKRHVQGWKKSLRKLIRHEYNLVYLCNWPCHLLDAHGFRHRELVARQIVLYGYDTLNSWVLSLPFKVPFHWDMGLNSDEEARKLLEEVQNDQRD